MFRVFSGQFHLLRVTFGNERARQKGKGGEWVTVNLTDCVEVEIGAGAADSEWCLDVEVDGPWHIRVKVGGTETLVSNWGRKRIKGRGEKVTLHNTTGARSRRATVHYRWCG